MALQGFINIAFDEATLNAIVRFKQFPSALTEAINYGLEEAGELLAQDIENETWLVFANPMGRLADSIGAALIGPMKEEVSVNVPYAWRMERGFHGADSLGRVYDQDGKPYAEPTLNNDTDEILELVSDSINNLFAQIGTP